MIDTHCHLYLEELFNDFNEIFIRSNNSGVIQCWLPAINSSYHLKMINLKKANPHWIKLMAGLHPCYVKRDTFEFELEKVKSFLRNHDCIAIGEIGIDLFWDKSTFEIQKIAFLEQIKIAKKNKLPIIIHSRESIEEIFVILENEKNDSLKGIFHCFSGNFSQAKKIIELGFLLGIGGMITFTNVKVDQFLHEIPLQHLVLETDSPYLAPVPFRGKRNDPSFLLNIVKKLSSIYHVSEEKIIEISIANSTKLIQ